MISRSGLPGSVALPGHLRISLNLSFHFCERASNQEAMGKVVDWSSPRDLLDLPRESSVHPDPLRTTSDISLQRTQGHVTCIGQ